MGFARRRNAIIVFLALRALERVLVRRAGVASPRRKWKAIALAAPVALAAGAAALASRRARSPRHLTGFAGPEALEGDAMREDSAP